MSSAVTNTIIATTSRGLDTLLAEEIVAILPHVTTQLSPGSVSFIGTIKDAYKLCLWTRLANRVLWVLAEGTVKDADALYKLASSINWSAHFSQQETFIVQFNGTNRAIKHTQFGAQKTKDAIVDHFVNAYESRPSVDTHSPEITIFARLRREQCAIGIDLSGSSLHQRHYRQEQGEAPLKEHVACAILMRSGWCENQDAPLIDPMCGSGTIAIEAALMASNTAPGLRREHWGFNHWKPHQQSDWQALITEANASIRAVNTTISASDIDRQLVAKAKKNADFAGVFSAIRFSHADALNLNPSDMAAGYVISNPPYGERLSDLANLVPLFTQWGKQLKQAWAGWRISLLTSNRELLRTLKLRASKEYSLMNGKLECKLVNYAMDEANLTQFNDEENHALTNRIRKNIKRLKPWLKTQQTDCYRIYDADLPEYNVAIDKYADHYVVQEYAPPKTIDEVKAKRRLQEVLLHLPSALEVSTDKLVLKVREQKKGKAQYEKVQDTDKRIAVTENGAVFLVNLWDYLDTGLFLDHRQTRLRVRDLAKDQHVLNLFAYTGSVSVMAALGGAKSVTTVDMSKTYIQWAKDNFQANKLQGAHAFIQADCTQWLSEHHNQYGLIFIDPPSFSNSKRMEGTWDVQRDHAELLIHAANCLQKQGTILFSNNKRGFKLDSDSLQAANLVAENITKETIPEDFSRRGNIHQCWSIRHAG